LPEGFPISTEDKFRNQQVLIAIDVPVGKRIIIDDAVNRYSWFDVNVNNRRGWNIEFNDYRDDSYTWNGNTEYIMTPDGLKKVKDLDQVELKKGHFKLLIEDSNGKIELDGNAEEENKNDKYHYRYKQIEDSLKEKAKDKFREEIRLKDSIEREKKLKEVIKSTTMNKDDEGGEDESLGGSHIFSPALFFVQI
jgi:hypothetical protein